MAQIKPLPAELQKVAIEELGEVPARIAEDLQAFKKWIHQQPHLKSRTDDQFLVQFLRGCKYRPEKARDKLDKFYSLRTKQSHLFSTIDVDDPKFRRVHNTGSYTPLPTPLQGNGPRIILMQLNFGPRDFPLTDLTKYAGTASEVMLLNDPYACINGVVLLEDYAKVTAKHLLLLTPSMVKSLFKFYAETFPVRIKAIYFINLPGYALKFLKVLLPCAPEKIRNRIFFCGTDLDDLGEEFPRKYLPRDYGGENGAVADLCAEHNKVWDEYREYFKQNAEYGIDERLRPSKPSGNDSMMVGFGSRIKKIFGNQ